ncbi:MAG: FkbM family methyltransferase [bacterium]
MTDRIALHKLNFLVKEFAKTFVDYMDDYEKFSKNYALLLKNLTKEQQEFLVYLFKRMIFTNYSIFYRDELFTADEQNERMTIQEPLLPAIQEGAYFRHKDYLLPINRFEVSVFHYHLGIDFLENKDSIEGTDIIDAGAYIGDSAMVLSRTLSPRKIYSFEPVSVIFNQLIDTIKVNKLNEVVQPVKLGLSSEEKEQEITIDGSGSTMKLSERSLKIPKEKILNTTIDAFVEKHNLKVSLIKMDTEGTELDILRGAEKTIREQKPVLLVSIYHNAEEFFEAKPLIESWNLGYKFKIKKLNPFNFIFETILICEA